MCPLWGHPSLITVVVASWSFSTLLSSLEYKGGGEGNSKWLSTGSGGKLDRERKRKQNPLRDGTFWSPRWSVWWPKQSHSLLLHPWSPLAAVLLQTCQQSSSSSQEETEMIPTSYGSDTWSEKLWEDTLLLDRAAMKFTGATVDRSSHITRYPPNCPKLCWLRRQTKQTVCTLLCPAINKILSAFLML